MENNNHDNEVQWKKAVIACILVLLLLLLLIQHSFVGLYYDDYGNASLSYGYDSSAIPGTDYSVQDLFEWAKYTYNNWGGRILYALILIPLTKYNAVLFGIVQSIIITLLFLVSYLLASLYTEKKQIRISGLIVAILVFFSLYGDISRYGIYWASASVLYVWPLLFFVLAAYVYEKACEKYEENRRVGWQYYLYVLILVPFVTLSQEQLGFAFVAWACCQLLLRILNKKANKLDIVLLIWSLVTFALFMIAPGNWKRLADSGDFAKLPIFQKVITNAPKVMVHMLHDGLRYFNVLLALAGLLMIWMCKQNGKYFRIVSSVIMIAQIVCIIRTGVGIADLVVFACFVVDMFLVLLNYYRSHKRRRLLQLYIAGVASICFLLVSPSLQMRSYIPYVCFFTILIGDVFSDFIAEVGFDSSMKKAVAVVSFTVLAIPSVYCATYNFMGYSGNSYIQQYNENILRSYDGKQERLYLLSYGDSRFRAQMPSDEGFGSIGYWIKEYYNIPQGVTLIWKPMEEYLELARKQEIEYKLGDGCYDKEGTNFWTQDQASIIIQNDFCTEIESVLEFSVFTGNEEPSRFMISVNGEKAGEWLVNNAGQSIETAVKLQSGENIIKLVTDAEQINTGTDLRKLFMRMEGLNVYRR